MDRSPGGWSELVTVSVLDARLGVLGAELRGEMARLEIGVERTLRSQTKWMISTSVAFHTALVVLLGIVLEGSG